MNTIKVKLSDLVLDYGLNPRSQLDRAHVAALREVYRSGALLPPPRVDAKSLRVIDGFHRTLVYQQELDPDAEVTVIAVDHKSDTNMFLDALECNSAHGLRLTKFDRARAVLKLRRQGIGMHRIAKALGMRVDALKAIAEQRVAKREDGQEIVLKRAVRHLRGQTLTDEQVAAQAKLGGNDARFIVAQLVALVETGMLNTEDEELMAQVSRLGELLAPYALVGAA